MLIKIIIAELIFFFSYTVHAITGFAGNVLAFPLSSYILGMNDTKVILNSMALISSTMIAFGSFKSVNWKELIKIILIMLIGIIAGIFICGLIPSESGLLTIYGILILCVGIKNLFFKKTYKLNTFLLIIILLFAGIIQGMYLSGGAFLVIYATQVLKDKNEIRATLGMVWVFVYLGSVITQVQQRMYTFENLRIIIIGVIPLIISAWLGKKLAKALNQEKFLKLTYILLIVLGVFIII